MRASSELVGKWNNSAVGCAGVFRCMSRVRTCDVLAIGVAQGTSLFSSPERRRNICVACCLRALEAPDCARRNYKFSLSYIDVARVTPRLTSNPCCAQSNAG